jgi:hypothetical protein
MATLENATKQAEKWTKSDAELDVLADTRSDGRCLAERSV